jgi:hypothetical protein
MEIRRKIGSFDTDVEVQNANYHFKDLIEHLSQVIVLSDADFDKKYSAIIENINKAKEENDKPWYAKKNVATAYIILGIVTLPFLIGFLILPLGIYARNKNKQYLNS